MHADQCAGCRPTARRSNRPPARVNTIDAVAAGDADAAGDVLGRLLRVEREQQRSAARPAASAAAARPGSGARRARAGRPGRPAAACRSSVSMFASSRTSSSSSSGMRLRLVDDQRRSSSRPRGADRSTCAELDAAAPPSTRPPSALRSNAWVRNSKNSGARQRRIVQVGDQRALLLVVLDDRTDQRRLAGAGVADDRA